MAGALLAPPPHSLLIHATEKEDRDNLNIGKIGLALTMDGGQRTGIKWMPCPTVDGEGRLLKRVFTYYRVVGTIEFERCIRDAPKYLE